MFLNQIISNIFADFFADLPAHSPDVKKPAIQAGCHRTRTGSEAVTETDADHQRIDLQRTDLGTANHQVTADLDFLDVQIE